MNVCFSDFTVNDLPNSVAVVVEFESMADNSKRTASGTTDGSGNLTITSANMPDFIAGVSYRMTFDRTWDTGECGIIDFEFVQDSDGIVTGASVTVEECES
jgi:hypothetical protein